MHPNFVETYHKNTNEICSVLSHEVPHMVLYHLERDETCSGLDRFLKKRKKYSFEGIGNGGI
jgi:predicted metal-dependent peptidase